MSEKPKRVFIQYLSMNNALKALTEEEYDREWAEIVKKKPEIQNKLGINEIFHGAVYGVSEDAVIALEADNLENKNVYIKEIGLAKWLSDSRTLTVLPF